VVRATLGSKHPLSPEQIVDDTPEVVGLARRNTLDSDLNRFGGLDRRRVVALDRGVGNAFFPKRVLEGLDRCVGMCLKSVLYLNLQDNVASALQVEA